MEGDSELNAVRSREPRRISPKSSRIQVLVMPTDEELEIARQSVTAL